MSGDAAHTTAEHGAATAGVFSPRCGICQQVNPGHSRLHQQVEECWRIIAQAEPELDVTRIDLAIAVRILVAQRDEARAAAAKTVERVCQIITRELLP